MCCTRDLESGRGRHKLNLGRRRLTLSRLDACRTFRTCDTALCVDAALWQHGGSLERTVTSLGSLAVLDVGVAVETGKVLEHLPDQWKKIDPGERGGC